MSGGFEVIDGVLRQQTPQMPIGWFGLTADTAPYTIIGAIDWADVSVAVDILLPKSTTGKSTSIGWVGARVSQTAEECDGAVLLYISGRIAAHSYFRVKTVRDAI
jgi:hypothetical protein|eukprot:COSAG03_NODE_853_length_5625_cov_94.607673_3_plen_105_part_00